MNIRIGLASLLLAAISTCLAESDANRRELSAVQDKIHAVGAGIRNLADEKNSQLAQLRKLEKQYGDQINALNEIKSEIRLKEQALQEVRTSMTALQKDVQAQQQGLQGLIKSAHAMGSQQRLSVMLNQRDPALSGRMVVYYDYLSKARVQKLQTIAADLQSLRQMEARHDSEAQLLQSALEKKQQEAAALQGLKQQRENLLAQIDQDYALKNGELSQLLRDEKKLATLVASLQKTDDNEPIAAKQSPAPSPEGNAKGVTPNNTPEPAPVNKTEPEPQLARSGPPFAEMKGELPWPVQGTISERFGSRRFESALDGAVIAAQEGVGIHAVAAGRVVYADWLRGYGLMLIVDHGKGFMSLYAYNQNLYKSVGETVKAGEVVAAVGRSGGRAQAALYFGIRDHGRAVDPERWCRKPAKG